MTTLPEPLTDPSLISLEGRVFAGVSNAETGQVSSATHFRYHEDGAVVWAEYDGGEAWSIAMRETCQNEKPLRPDPS